MFTFRMAMLVVMITVVAAVAALSQSFTGSILGSITDPTGSVIPNASIVVTNTATNGKTTVTSDQTGNFVVVQLPPGQYRIEGTAPGFKRVVREGITLQVQQQARVDLMLAVGEVSESVQVHGDAQLVESETSAIGKVVDNRRIINLPLNTRNVYSLIFLTPGVTGTVGNQYNSMSYSINGARATMMDTLIDGVTGSFPTVNGFTGISVFPSVDAIEQFKVQGSNYSAEFGRSLGNVLNVIYKSGTNDLHGSAYEFLRNSVLDANDFFANRNGRALGSFKRSQFGGVLNGPTRRNKTFFMASFEGLRERSFSDTTTTVPTLLERQGDFSQTFASNRQLITIYDPFTTQPNPGGSGFVRSAFTDNRIPANRFDPVALNVLQYYPLPNQPGDPITHANNYYSSAAKSFNLNQFDIRGDQNISDTKKFFARYSYRLTEDVPAIFFPDNLTIAEGRFIQENHVHNVVADYTQTISPTTVFSGRLGFARTLFVYNNQGLGFQPSSLGLPKKIDVVADRQMFPRFGAAGYVNLGGNDHRYSGFMSYSALASLTKVMGRHTIKAGFEGRMLRVNVWEARAAGTFLFTQGMTQGPDPNRASSTAGNSIASLLLGTGSNAPADNILIQGWKNVASQSFYIAPYFQDDWRVNGRLTLNLGVRYDLDTPRTERFNRMNYFDPYVQSPLAAKVPGYPDLHGGVVFVGVNGVKSQYDMDTNNLAPRFGFAYQLSAKTVIRGAYAHMFGPSNQAAQGTVGPFGFRVEYPWVTTVDGITPLNTLSNPFPQGFRSPPGASEGLLTQVGANLQAPLRDTATPWARQWNLNVQRELPWSVLLEVAYVGSRGQQLARSGESGLNLNQLDPKYMSLGSQLNVLVDNPFFGIVNNGILANRQVSRAQLLRPYPQFTDIIPLYSSGASSIYHSLQVSGTKRFSHGLQFDVAYTWAKNLDDGMNHQNSYDVAASRSLANIDVAHSVVMSYLYELPFGRGRRVGSSWSVIPQAILGGWQFNGITTFQTGVPLMLTANNSAGIFNPVTRPNNNGKSGKLDGPVDERLNAYFDKSVFSQPLPFTFGNLAASLPEIRNDGVRNFDLSVFKEFMLRERGRVQFRTEMLNAFNTPRFGTPNVSVTSTSFGVINSQANAPRQIQFGLKVLW